MLGTRAAGRAQVPAMTTSRAHRPAAPGSARWRRGCDRSGRRSSAGWTPSFFREPGSTSRGPDAGARPVVVEEPLSKAPVAGGRTGDDPHGLKPDRGDGGRVVVLLLSPALAGQGALSTRTYLVSKGRLSPAARCRPSRTTPRPRLGRPGPAAARTGRSWCRRRPRRAGPVRLVRWSGQRADRLVPDPRWRRGGSHLR